MGDVARDDANGWEGVVRFVDPDGSVSIVTESELVLYVPNAVQFLRKVGGQ